MPPGSGKNAPTMQQQRTLLLGHMEKHKITQAELATMIGRSSKHVNQVLQGRAGTHELDYWAWVLGVEFHVTLRELNGDA